MAIVGFAIGLLGFLLYTLIDGLANWRYSTIHAALELRDKSSVGAFLLAILLTIVITACLVLASSSAVVYIAPQAAASGVPEVMAYLNGCLIRKVFNIKTLIVKFVSCVLAVASGLPVGPEGPMIHLGAIIGAGLSQGESTTMGFASPIFPSLRNSKDKRDFITAGVAAGVAVSDMISFFFLFILSKEYLFNILMHRRIRWLLGHLLEDFFSHLKKLQVFGSVV